MKLPDECENINDIRTEIDNIDRKIIDLLGKRFKYVKEVVKFKFNKDEIVAQKRYDEVIANRREWAKENNLDPDLVEKIYRSLLNYFIEEEIKLLEYRQKDTLEK